MRSLIYLPIIFLLIFFIFLNTKSINQNRSEFNYLKIKIQKKSNLYAQDIAEEIIRNIDNISHIQKSLFIRNSETLLVAKNISLDQIINSFKKLNKTNSQKNNYECNLDIYRDCKDKVKVYCIPYGDNLILLCNLHEEEFFFEARNSNFFNNKDALIFTILESKKFITRNPKIFSDY